MEFRFQTQPWLPNNYCEGQIQIEISAIVRRCLSRIRSWPAPRNWSFRDWFYEAEEVATVAAWQAFSDYKPPTASEFPYFVSQRVLSSVRTRYRQEFLYGLRFGATVAEHNEDSDEQIANRTTSVEPIVESLACGDLTEALGKLSAQHQCVIEQLFFRGRTEADLAKSLGLSQRGISKRKQAALLVLRNVLVGM